MAMMAYTVDSRPELMPDEHDGGRAGRGASAISRTGAFSVRVKYSVRRLTTWASTRPMTTAPKHFQPGVERAVVADVDRATTSGADDGERAGGEEAAVDRLQAVLPCRWPAPRTRRRSRRARRWRGRRAGR